MWGWIGAGFARRGKRGEHGAGALNFSAHLPATIGATQIHSTRFTVHSRANPSLQRLGAALALSTLAIALAACTRGQAEPAGPPAALDVGVVTLQAQPLVIKAELGGRTVASGAAQIRPQVGGIVQQRLFNEGASVRAGQALYQLDAASYRATVASAQAGVAKAEASVGAAQIKAQRTKALLEADAGSRQDAEDAAATLQQAHAELASARAALTTAQINLERTRITAPISGRVDTSTVTPGALVTANQETALTTVQQLDPMHIDIPQSSAELLKLRAQLAAGQLDGGSLAVKLVLEDGSTYAQPAKLQVRGVAVNTTTGAVTLRATVPNPQGVLLPGMFVRAVLDQASDPDALLLPQAAVSRNARGEASAWVVGADGKATKRAITVAEAVGNQWRVTAGLAAGERVIVEGTAKVREGQLVRAVAAATALVNSVAASAAATTVAQN